MLPCCILVSFFWHSAAPAIDQICNTLFAKPKAEVMCSHKAKVESCIGRMMVCNNVNT